MSDETEGEGRGRSKPTSSMHHAAIELQNSHPRTRRSLAAMAGGRAASKQPPRSSRRKNRARGLTRAAMLLSLLAIAPTAAAQGCISLSGSTACPAFNTSSVSTDMELQGFLYVLTHSNHPAFLAVADGYSPFLQYVSNTATFDEQLMLYIKTGYSQVKYTTLFGCGNINLANTSDLYARYTTTVLCNAIIQNSKTACGLSAADSRPVCADSCAQFAQSESRIVSDNSLCSNPDADAVAAQIRADYTNCGLPANSLNTGTCIEGSSNEPDNCGFGNSTIGLCVLCAAGGLNSTDTCCYSSQAQSKCAGVVLPTITGQISLSTATTTVIATSSATSGASGGGSSSGLSGGAIAGIVIGSIVGLALIIGLILLLLRCLRRDRGSQQGSILNQPTPARRQGGPMAYNPPSSAAPAGYEVLPGGRIARMSALEGHSGDSPPRGELAGAAAVVGAAAGYAAGRRRHRDQSSSDEYGESPESETRGGVLRPPPAAQRRRGSLSSNSALGGDDNSPQSGSGGELSSPQGLASAQSEQLAFFKDYYSQDEIRPGDKVATLWAYQPRAGDEFLLERGDMLKVVGIWDDGWATGVMIDERAEDWEAKRNAQRDSGVSNGSGRRDSTPPTSGEIKAFPLVCVCLPEHWRKTIDGGDGSTETGSSAAAPPATSS